MKIEILKSIAKKISNNKDFAFVASFISRPVLHIRQKNDRNEKPSRSYTFIDAIKQFGAQLQKTDLLDAYAKAGTAFSGQLEQNFVVLKESDSEEAQTNFHKLGCRGIGVVEGVPTEEGELEVTTTKVQTRCQWAAGDRRDLVKK